MFRKHSFHHQIHPCRSLLMCLEATAHDRTKASKTQSAWLFIARSFTSLFESRVYALKPCVFRLIRLTSKSPTFEPIVAWLVILMPKIEIWCRISLPDKITAFARSRFKSLTLASQPCVIYILTVFTVFDTWTLTLIVTRARAAPLKRQCWTAWTLLVTVGAFR